MKDIKIINQNCARPYLLHMRIKDQSERHIQIPNWFYFILATNRRHLVSRRTRSFSFHYLVRKRIWIVKCEKHFKSINTFHIVFYHTWVGEKLRKHSFKQSVYILTTLQTFYFQRALFSSTLSFLNKYMFFLHRKVFSTK